MLKLISNEYEVFYQSRVHPTELVGNHSSTIFTPDTQLLAVGFGALQGRDVFPRERIMGLLEEKVGVLYFCDSIPKFPIIHENMIYIVSNWSWFTHTALVDFYRAALTFSSGPSSVGMDEKFSRLGKCKCKVLSPYEPDLKKFVAGLNPASYSVNVPKTLLFDTASFAGDRGLGDLLMATVVLKHLATKGWKIDVLCHRGSAALFANNPAINQVFEAKFSLNVLRDCSPQDREKMGPDPKNYGWHFTLATNLEDYSVPRNNYGRIDSLCELMGLRDGMEDYTPVICLTEEEKARAAELIQPKNGKPIVVLGLISTGSTIRTYPPEYREELFAKLSKKYTVVVTDRQPLNILNKDVVNLTGKLNMREWFMVVSQASKVLSMDTGLYWVGLAFKKPCIVMFTSIHPDIRINHHKKYVKALYPPMACKPCFDTQQCRDKKLFQECYRQRAVGGTSPCAKLFTPEMVTRAVKEFSILSGGVE